MPTYTLRNKESGEIFEKVMKMSEYDEYMKANPTIERCHLDAASLGDPVRLGFKKPDEAFRDLLRERKKAHYKNTINVM